MADTDTYYAWTRFDVERNEWGTPTKVVKRGDTVTAKDLGVSDEEFQLLVSEYGSVRNYPLPEGMPENYQGSPTDYQKEQLAKLTSAGAEGYVSVEEVNTGSIEPSESFNPKANEKANAEATKS